MKLSVDSGEMKPNQLVILLLCLLESGQCHSIADADSEATQDFHILEAKPKSSGLKVLLAQHRPNNPGQLEVPPVDENSAETQQAVWQTSTTSKPTTSISANTHHPATTWAPTTKTASTSSSPRQRWIDNILIKVELMNMFNEKRRQQISSEARASQGGEHDAQDEPPISVAAAFDESARRFQMATDSREDLLEFESETSTVASSLQKGSEPHSSASDTKHDRSLIESNNVSAILLEESLPPSSGRAESVGEARIVTMASKQVMSCEEAYTQCALREVCAPTLQVYNDECQDLLNNRTSECSPKCLRAMIALSSSEAGEDLAKCDCGANEFCQLSKQRSQLCQAQVERALEPSSVVSCSVASSICMANQLCSTALDYYYRRCQSLFSQRHCSDRCNNSLTILYKQPQAMKLINCQCDGSEEFPCLKYKTYTERLCLNRQTPPTNESLPPDEPLDPFQDEATATSHLETLATDEHDPQAASSNEDDKLNLTNDPSDLPPPAAGRTDDDEFAAAAAQAATATSVGGPPSDGTDPANANNYFFNGIQQAASIEDNWIPLLTSRYFTNLHQSRQHQQKVKQQQQRKLNSRRAQKNSKQKVRSNETNRKRNARPYMFALTSGATQASHSFILLASSCITLSLALSRFP